MPHAVGLSLRGYLELVQDQAALEKDNVHETGPLLYLGTFWIP